MVELNGQTYLKMLCNSAQALLENKDVLNKMNVFPVADGDTGINMYATVSSVYQIHNQSNNLGEISNLVYRAILSNSRGNSGTILATFFIGVNEHFKNLNVANCNDIIMAFKRGRESSYRMVTSPQEGTILTIMSRISNIDGNKFEDLCSLFHEINLVADKALKETPDLLPVLKKCGVLDSGAYGFTIMLHAMEDVICGNNISSTNKAQLIVTNTDEEKTIENIKHTKYAIIPIVVGEGFERLFIDSGAKLCINGGDTLNVSYECIEKKIKSANADIIILFANNHDTIPTCQLIKSRMIDKKIIVIPSISMAQGLSSLIVFDDSLNAEQNELRLLKALQKIGVFFITTAIKDANIGQIDVKKGQYILIVNKIVVASFVHIEEVFNFLSDYLITYSCVSIYYGKNVHEREAKEMASIIDDKLEGNVDLVLASGGQNIYNYLIVGE